MNPNVWTRTRLTSTKWHVTARRLLRDMELAEDRQGAVALTNAIAGYSDTHSELPANHRAIAFLSVAAARAFPEHREALLELMKQITGPVIHEEGIFLDPAFWARSYRVVVDEIAYIETLRKERDPVPAEELRIAMATQEHREANMRPPPR